MLLNAKVIVPPKLLGIRVLLLIILFFFTSELSGHPSASVLRGSQPFFFPWRSLSNDLKDPVINAMFLMWSFEMTSNILFFKCYSFKSRDNRRCYDIFIQLNCHCLEFAFKKPPYGVSANYFC